jgi:hypothetical protein
MARLSRPPAELATRLVQEVGFEERLHGVRMSLRAGSKVTAIYSLAEAVSFLAIGDSGEPASAQSITVVGYLHLDRLTTWVKDVLGDHELAAAIAERVARCDSYLSTARDIRRLLQERLDQCRSLGGE